MEVKLLSELILLVRVLIGVSWIGVGFIFTCIDSVMEKIEFLVEKNARCSDSFWIRLSLIFLWPLYLLAYIIFGDKNK